MTLVELSDLITDVLDHHVYSDDGVCECGFSFGGFYGIGWNRHVANMVVTAILAQGTGIAPNEAYNG